MAEIVKPLITVVAAILSRPADGYILLAQRPVHKSMGGLWEFPGGKIEKGETPEEALCRELQEELHISVSTSALLPFTFVSHTYDSFHLLMLVYQVTQWSGEPMAVEHQALEWASPVRLHEYSMPEADIPLIPLLKNHWENTAN